MSRHTFKAAFISERKYPNYTYTNTNMTLYDGYEGGLRGTTARCRDGKDGIDLRGVQGFIL